MPQNQNLDALQRKFSNTSSSAVTDDDLARLGQKFSTGKSAQNPNIPANPADPIDQWFLNLAQEHPSIGYPANLLWGGAKKGTEWFGAPFRMANQAGLLPKQFTPQKFNWEFGDVPGAGTQRFGRGLMEAAPYFALGGPEAKVAEAGTKIAAPVLGKYVSSLIGRSAAPALSADVAARINEQPNPETAGAVAGLISLYGRGVANPLLRDLGMLDKLKGWSSAAYERAMSPTGALRKFLSQKLVEPLAKMKATWSKPEELTGIGNSLVGQGYPMEVKAMQKAGPNAGLDWDLLRGEVDRATGEDVGLIPYGIRSDAAGNPLRTASGEIDAAAQLPATEQGERIMQSVADDMQRWDAAATTGTQRKLPLTSAWKMTQGTSRQVGRKGAYEPRMEKEFSASDEAARIESNIFRNKLRDWFGKAKIPEWQEGNRLTHLGKIAQSIGRGGEAGAIAEVAPWSERTILPFGTHLGGDPRKIAATSAMSTARRLINRPAFNSRLGKYFWEMAEAPEKGLPLIRRVYAMESGGGPLTTESLPGQPLLLKIAAQSPYERDDNGNYIVTDPNGERHSFATLQGAEDFATMAGIKK
jgi:hypothetical protein